MKIALFILALALVLIGAFCLAQGTVRSPVQGSWLGVGLGLGLLGTVFAIIAIT